MKHKKLFKSLDELSPELLASNVDDAILERKPPEEAQPIKQGTQEIFQPVNFLAETNVRAYRGWGINE